ncbi:MAG: ABC transporter permease [Candidatus Dormibacteraeota bacterium]|uniref:ABC transporter permease n=1 Tax=Candidatus Aeolococcus gillhamiae TaxID=3127015 RepID=A0A2W5ZZK7_9BACT|nr:ABC transporter permease [Candidatus Dormibacteraeota bacterium]PZR78698.1 MAG: peptide ABC transporter permease [Candidatus Dormibacter sp. RRmetagenome_bin12]
MTRGTAIYAAKRLLLVLGTALIVSSVTFLLVHSLAGTPFTCEKNPASCAHENATHGLNDPLFVQYRTFMWNLFRGDLGYSYVNQGAQVTPLLLREAGNSLTLGLFAVVVTIVVGLAVGITAAIKQNSWVDYMLSSFVVFGYSVPSFVLATFLIILTGILLPNWANSIGWGAPEQIPIPAIALGLPYAAIVARLVRASMLDVVRQDYVRTAWAKGLSSRVVIIRHALRNALIPVITIGGPLVTGIITGSVVIEYIFGVPGLGKEFVNSITTRDYGIVVGLYTFYAVLVGLANLFVDLLYPVLDPRIRYT